LADADASQTEEQKNILSAAVEGARQKLEQAQLRLQEHINAHSQTKNGEQVD
jgi:ribosome-associated translation inhibitor RaiA